MADHPIIDKVNGLFRPKPAPATTPTTPEVPEPALSSPKYLKAWLLLHKIPVQKLMPAITLTSGIVFLAISGLVAWLALFVAFFVGIFKSMYRFLRKLL